MPEINEVQVEFLLDQLGQLFFVEEKKEAFLNALMRDNAWEASKAEKVLNEYFKYLILAKFFDGKMIIPSDAVDQVWHAHVLHSRDYNDFCEKFFSKPFHHEPMVITETERNNFYQQYGSTLDFYKQVFGVLAPNEIWPSMEARASSAEIYQRINMHPINRAKKLAGISGVIGVMGALFVFFPGLVIFMFIFFPPILMLLGLHTSNANSGSDGRSGGCSGGSSSDGGGCGGCGGGGGSGGGGGCGGG